MPEGAHGYPRWGGELRTGPVFPVIILQEIRRLRYDFWGQSALLFVALLAVIQTGFLSRASEFSHTMDAYVAMLELLPWAALGLAAVMSGPALLEDARQGALELYLSRAATRWDYLLGKSLAVFLVTTLAIFLPALVYWGGSYFFFENHPDGWHLASLKAFGYAVMWGLMATGLGLGLSCVSRSSKTASLFLFGGAFLLHNAVARILDGITRSEAAWLLSPVAALKQQTEWIFGVDKPYNFETWWGLLVWGALVVLGWALVAWRHPRLKGV